jgi:hypothetical protein
MAPLDRRKRGPGDAFAGNLRSHRAITCDGNHPKGSRPHRFAVDGRADLNRAARLLDGSDLVIASALLRGALRPSHSCEPALLGYAESRIEACELTLERNA